MGRTQATDEQIRFFEAHHLILPPKCPRKTTQQWIDWFINAKSLRSLTRRLTAYKEASDHWLSRRVLVTSGIYIRHSGTVRWLKPEPDAGFVASTTYSLSSRQAVKPSGLSSKRETRWITPSSGDHFRISVKLDSGVPVTLAADQLERLRSS